MLLRCLKSLIYNSVAELRIVLGFHVGLSLLHGCACAFLGEIIEMMEQREQKPNPFGLCRVATEEGDSQMMEQREQKPNPFGLCRVATFDDGQK